MKGPRGSFPIVIYDGLPSNLGAQLSAIKGLRCRQKVNGMTIDCIQAGEISLFIYFHYFPSISLSVSLNK